MKICPSCNNTYSDDALQFCLQDGTPLSTAPSQQTQQNWTESETLVVPANRDRVQVDIQSPPAQTWGQAPSSQPTYEPAEPKKSNTLLAVILTALGMILLFGVGGIAAWLYLRSGQTEIAANKANVNSKPANSNTAVNSNSSENANANFANANSNTNSNANAAATPKPTLKPEEVKEVREGVNNTIEDWKEASMSLDLEGHIANYADTVDYYKGGKVPRSKVASDKQKAYEKYSDIVVTISNVKVTPGSNADEATAVFDKEWAFSNDADEFNAGKVQQELKLKKINGKWKITGERDLKVYFTEK